MNPPEWFFSEGPAAVDSTMTGDTAPATENPDGRIHLKSPDGGVIAQAALWWRETPFYMGRRIGCIGGFVAKDQESARRLLDGACDCLRERGCHIAVGPMNGNTWRRHRFVIESAGRGPFLLEPRNPPEHPGWWEAAGFGILSRYSSSAMPLDKIEPVSDAVVKRLEHSGVAIRKLDADRLADELAAIHVLSLRSFANNFLYSPLGRSEFVADYAKLGDRLDPDLVLIAERGGEFCGFVFAIPDLEAAARGELPAVIVKTLAVDRSVCCGGLGSLLVSEVHRIGRKKGFTEAIHALQHESNTSLKITGRHGGNAFRRYALFFKKL